MGRLGLAMILSQENCLIVDCQKPYERWGGNVDFSLALFASSDNRGGFYFLFLSKYWECCFNVKLINGGTSVKKYVSKRKTMILTLACTAALGTGVLTNSVAYADEPQQFTLEEMVVTASRVDTKKLTRRPILQ